MSFQVNADGSLSQTKKVEIIGSKTWAIDNGYYSDKLGFHSDMPDVFCTLKGRKEYIVDCSDDILLELKKLPNDSFLPIKLKVVTDYLKQNGIEYTIDGVAPEL